jgi:selenoprotein W-related protein
MAQELLTTFKDEPALAAITLIPSRPPAPGGQFLVQLHDSLIGKSMTLWDRRERGRFPELKELKQLVRDRVDPSLSLGHSDSDARKAEVTKTTEVPTDDGEWSEESESPAGIPARPSIFSPSISISYCVGCRWLLRAAWFGQEIVSTFEDKVHSVTLIPSRPPAQGGSFIITVDEFVVWDRSEKGRFPNITELKQLIRDQIDPSRDLGHGDHKPLDSDMMDESEAEEARRFFGVQ